MGNGNYQKQNYQNNNYQNDNYQQQNQSYQQQDSYANSCNSNAKANGSFKDDFYANGGGNDNFNQQSNQYNDNGYVGPTVDDEPVSFFEDTIAQNQPIEPKTLCQGLLARDPYKRKTCDDILKLAWKEWTK